jgi:hypothetical protein
VYIPSDAPRGPAELKKKRKHRAAEMVDSSLINPNEHRKAQRDEIQKDEETYQRRKGSAWEWVEVYQNLEVFRPRTYLSEKVICNHILDQWWALRFHPHPRPMYLPFTELHMISGLIVSGEKGVAKSFKEGCFGSMYRSVAPTAADKRVCFFLNRNHLKLSEGVGDNLEQCNHFFSVLFDYGANTAYTFGTSNPKEPEVTIHPASQTQWHSWQGPDLWTIVGHELGWGDHVCKPSMVTVVAKNWPQVC